MPNITISLSKAKLKILDEKRGDRTRYAFIKKLVEEDLDGRRKEKRDLERRTEKNNQKRIKEFNPFKD